MKLHHERPGNGWYDDTNGILCLFTGSSLNFVVFLIFENRQVMSLLTMAVCLLSQVWCASSGVRWLLNSPATRQRYVFIQSCLFCFSLWPPLSTSDVHDSRFFFFFYMVGDDRPFFDPFQVYAGPVPKFYTQRIEQWRCKKLEISLKIVLLLVTLI